MQLIQFTPKIISLTIHSQKTDSLAFYFRLKSQIYSHKVLLLVRVAFKPEQTSQMVSASFSPQ